ncbi:uncharacterized protein HMPREF1120_04259 [Exophiala dermatitidis NIH/UT8656]|uniref:Uncharacterized protein n=1 Tax=Exophiala dermatitidis (strain ATCC 34100 / CBS 525.76 / NIH/UT8656) TaxID=858893 RepID=H6BX08_EXODN|nr:uncharacterized protein HMPREF1120_04259 [Exophiala dermatitidis NIH/UT8656]EHY56164.1 hypothetical protein HMPREF1120_04259 [Exophiala dermatitidis NIH/UT8656]
MCDVAGGGAQVRWLWSEAEAIRETTVTEVSEQRYLPWRRGRWEEKERKERRNEEDVDSLITRSGGGLQGDSVRMCVVSSVRVCEARWMVGWFTMEFGGVGRERMTGLG